MLNPDDLFRNTPAKKVHKISNEQDRQFLKYVRIITKIGFCSKVFLLLRSKIQKAPPNL